MNVAVIGAGPSGLTACKTLLESGLDVICFEAGDRVGGQWVIDNTSGTSAAYRSLRTNTNKSMSRFSDFALPDDYPDYPGHEQMAAWFESYARHFGVLDHVRLGARVRSVIADPDGGFVLEADRGAERFDAVVVATGNLWDPVVPKLTGEFDGVSLHAKDYRDPDVPAALRGKTVVVAGLGNSGCEIAVELATAQPRARVLLAARSGQLVLPRIPAGGRTPPHPADPLTLPFSMLPASLRDALFSMIFERIMKKMRASVPDLEALGLPAPPRDLRSKRAVVNDYVLELIARKEIVAKPGVTGLSGDAVAFADGSVERADAIVYATGYRLSLPFLPKAWIGSEPEDLRLYQGVMHTRVDRLFLVGLMRPLCSVWPRSEQQARWIAALLKEEFRLPDRRTIEARAVPVLRQRFSNCQFYTHDLERERQRLAVRRS